MIDRYDTAPETEYRCPACGDPIDYCQGHGEIGAPEGFAVLELHDLGNHARCHIDGCEDSPAPSPFSWDSECRARAIFHGKYGDSGNVLTPDVIKYYTAGYFAVEVSRGEGFGGGAMFGVTVLTLSGERTEHSRSFGALWEAQRYVDSVRRFNPAGVTA